MGKSFMQGRSSVSDIGRYEQDLDRQPANHSALTPCDFMARAAAIYPARTALVHGTLRRSYAETYARCRRLAAALVGRGIGPGDTVSIMAPNVPAMLEAHFGVPMAGAVLNALNIRLDAASVAWMLGHARSRVLIADAAFADVVEEALAALDSRPHLVVIEEDGEGEGTRSVADETYESLLAAGSPDFDWPWPEDEWQAISLNYTSGTTGRPKGVVYHHRGAYLNALSNVLMNGMSRDTVYLWTLPMFHCNGWTHTLGGDRGRRHPRLPAPTRTGRGVPPDRRGARHPHGRCPGGARHADQRAREREAPLRPGGGGGDRGRGAAGSGDCRHGGHGLQRDPPLRAHRGLRTGAGGGAAGELAGAAARRARRSDGAPGVRHHAIRGAMVADPETLTPVPADGSTAGEIMLRGNTVMKGYLGDAGTTAEAFRGGWFHSGDLAVVHPDGYIQITDRAKDIIISGGENISSIEVENALYGHEAVLEAAVVARPDPKWGETPCAFVALKPDVPGVTEEMLIDHCRSRLAHFKAPRTIVFGDLPKTATGKIMKYALRERARSLSPDVIEDRASATK